MKMFLALCLLLFATVNAEDVKVISNEARVEHNGNFHYHYELGDGSKAIQEGFLKVFGAGEKGAAITGKYAFIGDDGQEYSTSYTADENGFQAYGGHLPTPPPVPESVWKTLKYIEDHPPYHPPPGRNY